MIKKFVLALVLLCVGTMAAAVPATGSTAQPTLRPGVPVSQFWPAREPGIPGAVIEYRLTEAYYAAFHACRASRSFEQCRSSVPAEFTVVRVR